MNVSEQHVEPGNENRARPRSRGCLVSLVVLFMIAVLAVLQIREPGRRADRVRQAINAGMSLEEMENLVNRQNGRQYIGYMISSNEQKRAVSRDEFVRALAGVETGMTSRAWTRLTFMGVSPGRVSFDVEFERNGTVRGIGKPYGWD